MKKGHAPGEDGVANREDMPLEPRSTGRGNQRSLRSEPIIALPLPITNTV